MISRAATLAHIAECLTLLDRHIPSEEQRQVAQMLGIEHMLPDPQPDMLKDAA